MENVALITGASSGIGRELAHIHAERGGDLLVVARRRAELEALAAELQDAHGTTVEVIVADLADPSAPGRIHDAVTDRGIAVEILINNAGFGGRGLFHERDWASDEAMIQVNVMALTALTRLFLPDFVARGTGRILNVSSTAALVPGPLQAVYYATKAFVTSFSNAIAGELHDTDVTVTALMPGATDTGFAARSGMDATDLFEKTVSARAVAEAGYEGMMAGKLDVIAGVSFGQRMQLKMTWMVPKSVLLKQIREMQEVQA
jgi:short-subunit dehydrogenase